MSEEDIVKTIFGWVGTALSSYFFFAPIVPVINIIKGKLKIKDAPYILLFISLLNCLMYTDYGLLKNDFAVYLTNIIGGGFTLIWLTTVVIFLAKKEIVFTVLYIFALIIGFIAVTLVFYFFVPADVTGNIVMAIGILVFASPLEKLYRVIKTYEYQLIPIFSTLGAFCTSLCWTMYGIYQKDYKIYAPNVGGLALAITQIIIYLIYYFKSKNKLPELSKLNDDVI